LYKNKIKSQGIITLVFLEEWFNLLLKLRQGNKEVLPDYICF